MGEVFKHRCNSRPSKSIERFTGEDSELNTLATLWSIKWTTTCFSVKLSLLENMTTVLCMAFSSSSLTGYCVSIVVIYSTAEKIHKINTHDILGWRKWSHRFSPSRLNVTYFRIKSREYQLLLSAFLSSHHLSVLEKWPSFAQNNTSKQLTRLLTIMFIIHRPSPQQEGHQTLLCIECNICQRCSDVAQLTARTPWFMPRLAPFLPLARPRPGLPDRPAPRGLRLPGKPEPRPWGGKMKMKKCAAREVAVAAWRGTRGEMAAPRRTYWSGPRRAPLVLQRFARGRRILQAVLSGRTQIPKHFNISPLQEHRSSSSRKAGSFCAFCVHGCKQLRDTLFTFMLAALCI